jgi:UDP:flavonoid glycosyltransferase YjiC (YdhE family)
MSKRILFFAEAVTLAHLARGIVLTENLCRHGGYIVALAADNRYTQITGQIHASRIPLQSITSHDFFYKLRKGLPIYDSATLSEYVAEDLKIIDAFSPDFIIGDFRLSLAISSRMANIPYATVTNAYWSPYANVEYPVPEIPLVKLIGVNASQQLFNWARPAVFFMHSLAFNRTCKKFGQAPVTNDMRDVYTHADYTLYADIESLIPMRPLPDNHLFIGPILWSAQVALPEWWENIPTDKPIVFVTLGSSGDSTLLPIILSSLSGLPITVLCVTANQTMIEKAYENVYIADFLPAEAAVKKADIIICNGGSPMVYQSLVENKQVIGIPSNLDQYLMMSIVHDAGKGQLIRSGQANRKLIWEAVNLALELMNNQTAQRFKDVSLAIDKITALIDYAQK